MILRSGMVHRRSWRADGADERELSVASDALGVGTVEWQAGEELGGHAPALAHVVAPARRTRTSRLRLAQLAEQVAVAPHPLEATTGREPTRP